MIKNGTIDYLCFIPFDFEEPTFRELDILVVDSDMGLMAEDIFKYAIDILLETITIDDVLNELDSKVFPKHVPNDSVNTCLSLCIVFISHLLYNLRQYKCHLNILVIKPINVKLDRYTSTLELTFSL